MVAESNIKSPIHVHLVCIILIKLIKPFHIFMGQMVYSSFRVPEIMYLTVFYQFAKAILQYFILIGDKLKEKVVIESIFHGGDFALLSLEGGIIVIQCNVHLTNDL